LEIEFWRKSVIEADESVTVVSVPEGLSLIARGVSLWNLEYEFDEPRRSEPA
jgi:hypothetical protein